MHDTDIKKRFSLGVIAFVLAILGFLLFLNVEAFSTRWGHHYSSLATSFFAGHTYFLSQPADTWYDTAFHNGKAYWPLGPVPALLLVPFTAVANIFSTVFYEGYAQWPLILFICALVYALARRLEYSERDCCYLVLAFLASAFLGVAALPYGWYFAQVLTVCFLLAALVEYIGRTRWWLIGILMALTLATRLTAGLGVLFFVLAIFFDKEPWSKKTKHLAQLLLPFAVTGALLLIYNFIRFGNPIESGYGAQLLWPYLEEARGFGIISLTHLPGNLYYFLLATPKAAFQDSLSHVLRFPYIYANDWGMSIFVTSPFLLGFFTFSYRDKISKSLLITIVLILLPILLYYGVGHPQFGYRYALDAFPFIFFLFLREYRNVHTQLTKPLKTLIVCSAFINLYLLTTLLLYYNRHIPWG